MTFGHLDIIDRASALFDRLLVGVAVNEGKHPLLTLEERLEMMRREVSKLPHASRIEVLGFDTLLVDAVRKAGAGTVVRGLRSGGISTLRASFLVRCGVLRRRSRRFFCCLLKDIARRPVGS